MYVDVRGKTRITNHQTKEVCDIEWKERTWSGKNANCFEGIVKNSGGIPKFKVHGNFCESIFIKDLSNPAAEDEQVYQIRERPDKADHFYYFSLFTMQINYLTDEIRQVIPYTDARLRPDQRFYENGDMEQAAFWKDKLEVAQRKRRKEHEDAGTEHIPAYFEFKEHPLTGEKFWQYNGKYWEDREKKDWSRLIHIYEE